MLRDTTHEAPAADHDAEGDDEVGALSHRAQYLRDVQSRRAESKARHEMHMRGPRKPAGLSPKAAKNLVLVLELTVSEGRFEGRRVWPCDADVALMADIDKQLADLRAGALVNAAARVGLVTHTAEGPCPCGRVHGAPAAECPAVRRVACVGPAPVCRASLREASGCRSEVRALARVALLERCDASGVDFDPVRKDLEAPHEGRKPTPMPTSTVTRTRRAKPAAPAAKGTTATASPESLAAQITQMGAALSADVAEVAMDLESPDLALASLYMKSADLYSVGEGLHTTMRVLNTAIGKEIEFTSGQVAGVIGNCARMVSAYSALLIRTAQVLNLVSAYDHCAAHEVEVMEPQDDASLEAALIEAHCAALARHDEALFELCAAWPMMPTQDLVAFVTLAVVAEASAVVAAKAPNLACCRTVDGAFLMVAPRAVVSLVDFVSNMARASALLGLGVDAPDDSAEAITQAMREGVGPGVLPMLVVSETGWSLHFGQEYEDLEGLDFISSEGVPMFSPVRKPLVRTFSQMRRGPRAIGEA